MSAHPNNYSNEWNGLKRYHLLHTSEGSDINRLFLFLKKHVDKISTDQLSIADVKEKVLKSNSHKSVLNALSTLKLIVDEYLVHHDLIKYQSDQDLFRDLTEAHIAEKKYRDVLYGAESYNWSRITSRDYTDIDEALNPSCHRSQSVHYIMMRSLYELNKHQTDACYHVCRELFEAHHESLDPTTCQIALGYMRKYIVSKLTDLKSEWYAEICWIYQIGLDHGYYLFNGTLDSRFYS